MKNAWRKYEPCLYPCEGLGQQPGPQLRKLLGWQQANQPHPLLSTHSISPVPEQVFFPSSSNSYFMKAKPASSPSVLFPLRFPGIHFRG